MLNPDFLQYYLNSRLGKSIADKTAIGNAQKTITLGDLRKFPIPKLPIAQQVAIVNILKTIEKVTNECFEKRNFYNKVKRSVFMENFYSGTN